MYRSPWIAIKRGSLDAVKNIRGEKDEIAKKAFQKTAAVFIEGEKKSNKRSPGVVHGSGAGAD